MEATGINAAASTGDAIGSGRFGAGGVGLAMTFLPVGKGKAAVSSLMKDFADNPGNWKTVGALVETAVNKKAKGGVSIQTIFENESGERLVRHTVLTRAGKVIDDHLRPMAKPYIDP